MWTELGKPQLDGKIRHLEAYDGHQLTLLGSLTCDVEWNGSRLTQKQLAVVQSDKEFGLLGRDLLPKYGVNITTEHIPAVKGYKAHVRLIPGTQPMFCKARKIPLPLQYKVTEKLEQVVRQGILEPVQPGGVMMHLQWCSRERRVEKWDFAWTWKCTQWNQRCCDLSRRCIEVWNYQGAVRQENACSQASTTWEKFYY